MSEPANQPAPAPGAADGDMKTPSPTELRFLTPDMCRIHLGVHSALHVTVMNERIYGGVYAAYAFPVAHPDGYISLLHTSGLGPDIEIGIIRHLSDFPQDQADLVRRALDRRYFIHTITKIHQIGWKYGLVSMDVDTNKGPVSFLMRWRHDQAVDYGKRGKVLIDVNEKRYLIPDLDALSPSERSDFTRIVYW